jgi:quercetin dioxygenase-like cupin family protein
VFVRRVTSIGPGKAVPYDAAAWRDALVVVLSGELELECRAGGRRRFECGDILWLEGLDVRRLGNGGAVPTVLLAISRWDNSGVCDSEDGA